MTHRKKRNAKNTTSIKDLTKMGSEIGSVMTAESHVSASPQKEHKIAEIARKASAATKLGPLNDNQIRKIMEAPEAEKYLDSVIFGEDEELE